MGIEVKSPSVPAIFAAGAVIRVALSSHTVGIVPNMYGVRRLSLHHAVPTAFQSRRLLQLEVQQRVRLPVQTRGAHHFLKIRIWHRLPTAKIFSPPHPRDTHRPLHPVACLHHLSPQYATRWCLGGAQ